MHVLPACCRPVQGEQPAGHSCASAAAATLQDVVASACHEARLRLRLYDHGRGQLLEAAAQARQGDLQLQQWQAEQQQRQRQEGVFKVPRPRPVGRVSGTGAKAAEQGRQHGLEQRPAADKPSGTGALG